MMGVCVDLVFDNLSAGEIKRKECFMYEGKNGTARELVVKLHEVYGGEAWFPSDGRAEDCILATCTGANINLEQGLAIFTHRPVVSVRWHTADATLVAVASDDVELPLPRDQNGHTCGTCNLVGERKMFGRNQLRKEVPRCRDCCAAKVGGRNAKKGTEWLEKPLNLGGTRRVWPGERDPVWVCSVGDPVELDKQSRLKRQAESNMKEWTYRPGRGAGTGPNRDTAVMYAYQPYTEEEFHGLDVPPTGVPYYNYDPGGCFEEGRDAEAIEKRVGEGRRRNRSI
jgi:hypothetical protein